ncbi:hypothetical protein C2G38_1509812 [Gigaspora rosea]|uniref:Uncharacterized protein n=1 Tax=Gigaspora rosea TaxID=44941 RepID=A0A397V6B1_9GLOM|nr:hypothetical protein C2G38_1509812 [Gigaspora rosea]
MCIKYNGIVFFSFLSRLKYYPLTATILVITMLHFIFMLIFSQSKKKKNKNV